ncbi:hypothetical protein PIB30_036980 [Stylosanthes scabra]|uniref:Uncharacterized protein n=1 Tax=Stylosanthes scabra TaxID=79078 RepID=A0ABU6YDY4_9FABA|nr:hypothetical protein [Stylosanthes scabra]
MIAWPLFAEQRTNAAMVTDALRVALRPNNNDNDNNNGVVLEEQIADLIKRLMEGSEGEEIRRHDEIRQVRGEYDAKVSSLERQVEGVCGLLTVMLQQMNPGKSEEDIAALV